MTDPFVRAMPYGIAHTHTMVVVLFLQYHTMIPLTPASSDHDTIPAPRLLHVSPAGNGSLQAPGLPAGNEISFYGICAVAGSYGVTGSCTFHKFLRGRRFLSVHIPQVPARSQVLVRAQSPVHAKLHRFLRILRFLRCRALWVTSVPGRQRVNILSDRDDIAPAPVTISKPDLAIPNITATYIL